MRIVRMSFRSPRYNNTAVSQVTSSLTQGGILKCQFRQSLENNGGGPELLQEKFHCWIPETPEINASRPIQLWTKVWRKNFICGSFVYYTCPSHTPNVKYDAGNSIHSFSWLSTLYWVGRGDCKVLSNKGNASKRHPGSNCSKGADSAIHR